MSMPGDPISETTFWSVITLMAAGIGAMGTYLGAWIKGVDRNGHDRSDKLEDDARRRHDNNAEFREKILSEMVTKDDLKGAEVRIMSAFRGDSSHGGWR